MLNWILNLTRLGKLNEWLSGNRALFLALAAALGATAIIVTKAVDGGLAYLMHVASTEEGKAAWAGWVAVFLAIKGKRIEEKIDAAAGSVPVAK